MIKVNPLIMRSFQISARCMVLGRVIPCYTIHAVILNANGSIELLFRLMKTLDREQKPNWPVYLPTLVYATMLCLMATTGFQPYELMFGCKALMPCNNWLGLSNYKPDSFKSKTAWLNQQLNAMLYANKQALKLIHQSDKPQ